MNLLPMTHMARRAIHTVPIQVSTSQSTTNQPKTSRRQSLDCIADDAERPRLSNPTNSHHDRPLPSPTDRDRPSIISPFQTKTNPNPIALLHADDRASARLSVRAHPCRTRTCQANPDQRRTPLATPIPIQSPPPNTPALSRRVGSVPQGKPKGPVRHVPERTSTSRAGTEHTNSFRPKPGQTQTNDPT